MATGEFQYKDKNPCYLTGQAGLIERSSIAAASKSMTPWRIGQAMGCQLNKR